MLKILFFITIIFANSAKAQIKSQDFGYEFCNHHKFTFFAFKAYDVYLCTNNAEFLAPEKIFNTDFSLIIKYNLNFDKNELAKSSLEEINRYYDLDKKLQANYHDKLIRIFPNVKKNDVIEAKYDKKGSTKFYHNNSLVGAINEAKFSRIFLDIWLFKENKYQKMTQNLFSQKN